MIMNTRLKPTSTYCLVAGFMVCTLILSGWKFHPNSASKIIQDTTKSGKKESATYSRKSIITYDKDGTPHEEVIEDFSGDEEMKEAMKIIAPFPLTMPTTPGFPGFISPGFFEGLMVPPFTDEMMDRDTVDFKNFRFNGKMLEDLRDMEMMMKENFENFQQL